MKVTIEDVKEICIKKQKCESCIFYDKSFEACMFIKTPCDWDLEILNDSTSDS